MVDDPEADLDEMFWADLHRGSLRGNESTGRDVVQPDLPVPPDSELYWAPSLSEAPPRRPYNLYVPR